jgi:hypothetical protein
MVAILLSPRDRDDVTAPDDHSYQLGFAPLRNISLIETLTVEAGMKGLG